MHANKLFLQEYAWKDKSADEETRKYSDKLRDVCALAERLGCSFGQLAIAWSLKNESVQCLLLGASNIDQLYESLQSLQVTIKLFISLALMLRIKDLRSDHVYFLYIQRINVGVKYDIISCIVLSCLNKRRTLVSGISRLMSKKVKVLCRGYSIAGFNFKISYKLPR